VLHISILGHLAAAAAAVAAGAINAIAGGGTLITFPVLTAVGVPAVRANATNTVSVTPGYIGGTWAQRADLDGLAPTLRGQLVVSALGGLAGSILLIVSGEALFRAIVPYLILAACALLAAQDRIRALIRARSTTSPASSAATAPATGGATVAASAPVHHAHPIAELLAVGAVSIYGGYFGAGLGIMLVAVLGVLSDRPFLQLNAVKQLLSFVINVAAAAFFVISGRVVWTLVAVMAPAALVGGNLGGRLARLLPAGRLRPFVIVFGVAVAIVYLVK
jgi:uncharacterized membrane protein YfcA